MADELVSCEGVRGHSGGTRLILHALQLLPQAFVIKGPHPGNGAWPIDRSLERAENAREDSCCVRIKAEGAGFEPAER